MRRTVPIIDTRHSYVGIDPGAKGALALLHDNHVTVIDIPQAMIMRGRSRKPVTDLARLWSVVQLVADYAPVCAAIEKVWGVKGQGGSTGAALGHARGCLEMAFHAAGVPVVLVSPQRWKADLGLYNQSKEASLQLALETFPDCRESFRQIRGWRDKEQCIGRAEAALIAWHAAGGRAS